MHSNHIRGFTAPAFLVFNLETPEVRFNVASATLLGIEDGKDEAEDQTESISLDGLPDCCRECITELAGHTSGGNGDADSFVRDITGANGKIYEARIYHLSETSDGDDQPALFALLSAARTRGDDRALIHDLRNHLNAISINGDVSSLLLDQGIEGNDEKLRMAIRRIIKNARQAASKLEQIQNGDDGND